MNKKILSSLLLLVFLFALIACGQDQKDVLGENFPENDNYYEVFVRSFADSDGDGIGDFNGIKDKLDYFVDLGITALWLMPINPSPAYHGYDVTDYYDVNPDYGTMTDFENLVDAANDLGIRIILDMVFNHTSDQHPWFQSALDGDETYKAYYNFIDPVVNTTNLTGAWGQTIWHSSPQGKYCAYFLYNQPDLNLRNEAVFDEIVNISKFWIDKGVKGFRLDAVHHYFGTNEFIDYNATYLDNILFLQDYMDEIDAYSEDIFVTGEVFEDQLYKVVGDYFGAVDSPLDFPVASLIRTAARSNSSRLYASKLEDYYDYYRRISSNFISSPFIVNHDLDRYATQVMGDELAIKLSAEMLLTLPGSPIIYYGEELGMYGYKASGPDIYDETRRTPLLWGDDYETDWIVSSHQDLINVTNANSNVENISEQLLNQESILNVYKRLLHLRNDNIALKYGNSFVPWEDSTDSLQGYYREFQYEDFSQKVLVIHNLSTNSVNMIEYSGNIIYMSNTTDYDGVTEIPAKSTIVIEIIED